MRTIAAVLFGVSGVRAQPTIPVVPGTAFPTIQSGINAAGPGDFVLVAPGVYLEDVDFLGKSLRLAAARDRVRQPRDGRRSLAPSASARNGCFAASDAQVMNIL